MLLGIFVYYSIDYSRFWDFFNSGRRPFPEATCQLNEDICGFYWGLGTSRVKAVAMDLLIRYRNVKVVRFWD